MSEKKKQTERENTPAELPEGKTTRQKEKTTKPCVYCGPSVKGVARQYTVYSGEIPPALADFIKEHPEARALVVDVERFAEVRKNLSTSGTAEAILYQKIKADL